MNYLELLKQSTEKFDSIVCMGLDPVLTDIPLSGEPGEVIYAFYETILNQCVKENVFPGSVKPNYAFYAQYGISGITSLHKIIEIYKSESIPVILDVKRGDIGKTALAYAKEAFDFFNADSVTLAPYMGLDSIKPFIDHGPEKGYYILTKTSNSSSVEIQDIKTENGILYEFIAQRIIDWYHPGIGSVVGATYPEQLEKILSIFNESDNEIPLLIPGIGAQGGSLTDVLTILRSFGDISIHRINSSSGINYAYKKSGNNDFASAAIDALKELNDEINV